MPMTEAVDLAADVRVCVAIDLIGDLDATLGTLFSDTLASLVTAGATDVVLKTRYIALTSEVGIRAIDVAVIDARAKGCIVFVDAGSRRMKAAFAAGRVSFGSASPVRPSTRHLMIARHASKSELLRSA